MLAPMRLEKTVAVLTLARALAGHFEGLTLDEMAALLRVGRRTAERMRDAVEAAFGPLERGDDGRKARFRLAARSLGNFASAPTAEELTELENAARVLEAAGDDSRAAALRSLRAKIGAALREADRRRLSVDVEAKLRAEAFACPVGPRPLADAAVLTRLREALLAGLMVKFDYENPSTPRVCGFRFASMAQAARPGADCSAGGTSTNSCRTRSMSAASPIKAKSMKASIPRSSIRTFGMGFNEACAIISAPRGRREHVNRPKLCSRESFSTIGATE